MPADDSTLYGVKRKRKLAGGAEVSSSLAFTSKLNSLIDLASTSSSAGATTQTSSGRKRPKKDDIFTAHNRNTAKRAERDLAPDDGNVFAQKHTTNGAALDPNDWTRSRRKMEDKARLYAAIKRGDLEDDDERYAVDFDRKWAEARDRGSRSRSASPSGSSTSSHDNADTSSTAKEQVEYIDEFGRTRKGTRLDARIAAQARANNNNSGGSRDGAGAPSHDDRFTARPSAPAAVIYGDTIQHQAFNPDASRADAMAALAAKRDRSLTPPPDEHFDGDREVRRKGTGFFQFSRDAEERKAQMAGLEAERAETERVRLQRGREDKLQERRRKLEERRQELLQRGAKRKADEFLQELGAARSVQDSEVGTKETAMDPIEGTDAAITQRDDDGILEERGRKRDRW